VPPVFELTRHVTLLSGLLAPVTVALNWRLLPLTTDWLGDLIVTLVIVGIRTVTEATPYFDGSTEEAAITYSVVKVSLFDIVSKPLAFMSVPRVTAPVP
jgi:hypothetical protein